MESKYLRKQGSENENLDFRFGSSSSASGEFCRICHESDSINPLITPCMCSGSLRYVHQNCLQLWLSASETSSCELCKYPFNIQSKVKPFSEWKSLEMTGIERRRLFCAVLFHVAAALCVIWSLCVLIERSAEEVRTNRLEWPLVTKLIVVIVGLSGGVAFMYIQCKQYLNLCYRWRARNRILLIQNAPEKIKNIGITKEEHQMSHNSSSLSLRISNSSNFIASTEVTIENNNEVFQPPSQIVAKIENTYPIHYDTKNESSHSNYDMGNPSTSKSFIAHNRSESSGLNTKSDADTQTNCNELKTQTSIFSENNDILNDINYPQINNENKPILDETKSSARRFSDTKLFIVDNDSQQASASSNNRSSQLSNTNNLMPADNQNKIFKSLPNIVNV